MTDYKTKLKTKDAVRLIAIWFCLITIGLFVWAVGGVVNWLQKVGRIIYDGLLNKIDKVRWNTVGRRQD